MPLYERTKRWLRRNYPCPFTVRIRRKDASDAVMSGARGWFMADRDDAVIYIAGGCDVGMAETLIEEWAHALRHALPMPVDYEVEPHDPLFWATYGLITNDWRQSFFGESHEAF